MAIEIIGGRPRSVRTEDELIQEMSDSLDAMSPEEQAAVFHYLDCMERGEGDVLDQYVKVEYLEEPVDPLTFLRDDYYLGQVGNHMWPQLQRDFVELFEGGYSEAVLTGSLGWGKSFFATCGLAYVLYQMSCLANPQEVYGLATGTSLAIALLSATREAARRVPLAELGNKLQLSPYFKEKCPYKIAATMYEIRFPTKKMMVVAGSTSSAAIGTNVFAGFLDEMAFMGGRRQLDKSGRMVEVDKSEVLTKAIVRRMKSRFMKAGKLPGLMFLVSSKEKPVTFIEQRIEEARSGRETSVFIRDYCLTGDTIIPLLDGTERRLDDLFAEFGGTDDRFEVYSFDVSKGCVVPGRAFRPRLTARDEETLEIELDNGEVVKATPWHPFMLKDGTYRRADELRQGDSLMPLYRRLGGKGYEEVAQPWWGGSWQKTHHMAARAVHGRWPRRGSDGKRTVIHHEDFDKRNNTTTNLRVMEWDEHVLLHQRNMTALLRHVRGDDHRQYASAHMKALHQDEDFARARDERGRRVLARLREDEGYRERQRRAASKTLSDFHRTEAGRAAQAKRNLDRWDGNRKIESIGIIEDAARNGESITGLALRLGCSPGAICQRLVRAGMPRYSEIKKAAGHDSPNHKVVAVRPGCRSDVYDLSVEGLENFAVGSGVFVHNSTWDVKPKENFSGKTFQIAVGNETIRSKIDPNPDDIAWYEGAQLRVIDAPEEYRGDFESDLEGALRDIAGIASESVSLFIHRREKIIEAIDETLQSPIDVEEWMSGEPLEFWWERVALPFERPIPGGFTEEAWRPIRHPGAVRYVHIDVALVGDCAGLTIAHVAGHTEVTRRDAGGESYAEVAPVIESDLMLRIFPPPGDEIFLGDIRGIVYEFQRHGFIVSYASMDSWQSADTRQQFKARGIESEVLSVDKTVVPYETMKTALYENRLRIQNNAAVQKELRALQKVQKTKGIIPKFMIDHPLRGSKDITDSLAGVTHSLMTRQPGPPMAPMVSERNAMSDRRDDTWVTGGRVMVPPSAGVRGGARGMVGQKVSQGNMPMPFTRG